MQPKKVQKFPSKCGSLLYKLEWDSYWLLELESLRIWFNKIIQTFLNRSKVSRFSNTSIIIERHFFLSQLGVVFDISVIFFDCLNFKVICTPSRLFII